MRFGQLVLALVLAFTVAAAVPVAAQAVSVCEYVPPNNALRSLALSGGYHQFSDRYSDNRGDIDNGNLLLHGIDWIDGPEWGYRLEGQADLQFSSAVVDLNYSLDSNSDFRWYWNADGFLLGGLDTSGNPMQSGLSVKALAGGGWGRYQNVSPLAKAIAVVTMLQSRKVISVDPSRDTMLTIAQAIEQDGDSGLSAVLLKELETRLSLTLDLAEVLAVNKVLSNNVTRYCGWDATLSVAYKVMDSSGSPIMLRATTSYATAPDTNSQIQGNTRIGVTLPLTGAYTFNASVRYTRALSLTAALSASYIYLRQALPFDNGVTVTGSHGLKASMRMRVDAALSVLFEGQLTLGTGFEQPEWGMNISFQYDLY